MIKVMRSFVLAVFFISLSLHAGHVFPDKLHYNDCDLKFQEDSFKIISGQSDRPTHSSLSYKPEIKHFVTSKGPFAQPMAIMMDSGNRPVLFGSMASIENASIHAPLYKNIVEKVTLTPGQRFYNYRIGEESVLVHHLPAISGSALNKKKPFPADLDLELTLLVQHSDFQMDSFYHSDSLTTQILKKHLQMMVRDGREKGLIFSDLKAGEFDYVPESSLDTMSKAIKWTQEEVLEGKKKILNSKGEEIELDLAQALSQESRVKLDWIIEIENNPDFIEKTGLQTRTIEVSILVLMAGQRGKNSPVLKVARETVFPAVGATGAHMAEQNKPSHLPIRITTAFFDVKDAELARKLSVSVPEPNIAFLNKSVMSSMKTYWNKGKWSKVLSSLATRLYYWPDFEYFKQYYEKKEGHEIIFTAKGMQGHIESVLGYGKGRPNTVTYLKIFSEISSALNNYKKLYGEDKYYQEAYKKFYQGFTNYKKNDVEIAHFEISSSLEEAESQLDIEIQHFIEKRVGPQDLLKKYIDYVFSLEYANSYEQINSNPFFISFALPKKIKEAYEKIYLELIETYPGLVYTRPEDIHMTISYIGSINKDKISVLEKLVDDFENKIVSNNIVLSEPSVELIGRNNSQLALTYRADDSSNDLFNKYLKEFKMEAYQVLGLTPDRRVEDDILFHISFAYVGGYLHPDDKFNVTKLLYSFDIPKEFNQLKLSNNIKLLEVQKDATGQPVEARYKTIRANLSDSDF